MTAVFAHRGYTEGCTENTVEAFAEAKRHGADGVELDVRLTRDGALAVHHDAAIAGLGPLSTLAVPDLPPHVPLLSDVLAVCEGMTVNVEIKNDPRDPGHDPSESVASLVAAAIDEVGWTERVIVSSFQLSTLHAVRTADPRLAVGALWPVVGEPSAYLAEAIASGWQAVHPFVTMVDADLVGRAHAAGLALNVWTVNARADLESCVALGVEAVITDRVDDALEICGPGAP
ncbi:MAG TPA: glycerophosphodiester phosphodiesterase [Acidimicrobiales bacterium]|nr:glycerophosphodiester phosphodiesterase [Acidimicrobiales bacterium]